MADDVTLFKRILHSLGFAEEHHDVRLPRAEAVPAVTESHGRLIDEWMERTTGKSVNEVTTEDVLAVPRSSNLRYAPLVSPLGGRLDGHLRHLSDDEARDLQRLGDDFLDATPADPDAASSQSS